MITTGMHVYHQLSGSQNGTGEVSSPVTHQQHCGKKVSGPEMWQLGRMPDVTSDGCLKRQPSLRSQKRLAQSLPASFRQF